MLFTIWLTIKFFQKLFFKETACVLMWEERRGQMGNGSEGLLWCFPNPLPHPVHSRSPLLCPGALAGIPPLSCTSFSLPLCTRLTLTSSNWTELILTLQLGEDRLKLTFFPFPLISISCLNKIEKKREQLGPWRNKSPQGWGRGRQRSLNQVQ